MTEWWEIAACRGRWLLFDSTDERDHNLARSMCVTCPSFIECRTEVERIKATPGIDLVGTWAGELYGAKMRLFRQPTKRKLRPVRRKAS